MKAFYPNTILYLPNKNEYYASYYHERFSIKNIIYGHGHRGNYCSINLPADYADVVFSSGVLEHVHEYQVTEFQALSEINRVMKKNGFLFIWNLPYKYGSVEILNILLRRWHHSRRFIKEEIIKLLKETCFEIVFFDHHELMNIMMRNVLGKIIGHENAFIFDYYISKIPIINFIAQHFTIVARKM